MPPRMTPTAWGQGAKNALICGVRLPSCLARARGSDRAGRRRGLARFIRACLCSALGPHLPGLPGDVAIRPKLRRSGFAGLWPASDKNSISSKRRALPNYGTNGWPRCIASVDHVRHRWTRIRDSFAAYWLIMATGRLQVRENGYLAILESAPMGQDRLLSLGRVTPRCWSELRACFPGSKGRCPFRRSTSKPSMSSWPSTLR